MASFFFFSYFSLRAAKYLLSRMGCNARADRSRGYSHFGRFGLFREYLIFLTYC